MAGVLVHEGKLTKRAIRSASNWKPRHFKLWRCEGDSPVLEYGKVGSSTPSGFIILSFGTTVGMEENLTSKSKNGIYLKTPFAKDDTPVKRLSGELPEPEGYFDPPTEYLDTLAKKVKQKIKRSRSRYKSPTGKPFVELFAYAATREDAEKWVEVIKKEVVQAHGLVSSKSDVQLLSRPKEIKVPSALKTLGLENISPRPRENFDQLLKKAHDEEVALQREKDHETSLVQNSVTHCVGAPRNARAMTVTGVIDVTEVPFGQRPRGQNWTAMYQGNVRRLFDMCRIAKVTVPPEGAFIRNRADGSYFQVTNIKSRSGDDSEDAPEAPIGMFDLQAKMLAKLKDGKITEAEYNHIMQVPQLHEPMTEHCMAAAQNLPTSHSGRLLRQDSTADGSADASGPQPKKSEKPPPVPPKRHGRQSSFTIKPASMEFKNGKWTTTAPLIPTIANDDEPESPLPPPPPLEDYEPEEPPTPPPPEGKPLMVSPEDTLPEEPPPSPAFDSLPEEPPPPLTSSDEDCEEELETLLKPPPSTEKLAAQI